MDFIGNRTKTALNQLNAVFIQKNFFRNLQSTIFILLKIDIKKL